MGGERARGGFISSSNIYIHIYTYIYTYIHIYMKYNFCIVNSISPSSAP